MYSVVMLSWEYPPHVVGGLSRHVHALSRELAAAGHRVDVLTRSVEGHAPYAFEEGVHVHRVKPYFHPPEDFRLWVTHLNFAMLEAGVRLLGEVEGPVILHAHDWLVAHAAKGLKHLHGCPLVATLHATEHGRHHGIHDSGQQYINDVEWWLTYEAGRVIVCSQAMRMEVRTLFGLTGDKVSVIPNGITVTPTAPRPHVHRAGERLIFHIGRLVPEKGAAVLIEALPLILAEGPVRLVIAGVGPCHDQLREHARSAGVAERVDFVGWVGDATVAALYRAADVAVVPSLYEPFGIVALEAMAARVPLVVSDVGGLAEIVRHGRTGLKAPPGEPVSLAQEVIHILRQPERAEALAANALDDVRSRYSWDAIARATTRVYHDVLEAPGPSSTIIPHPRVNGDLPGRYAL